METKAPKRLLTESDKSYIINNFKNFSAAKIAKILNKEHPLERPFTGPIIYSIVNTIRVEVTREIIKLKSNTNQKTV